MLDGVSLRGVTTLCHTHGGGFGGHFRFLRAAPFGYRHITPHFECLECLSLLCFPCECWLPGGGHMAGVIRVAMQVSPWTAPGAIGCPSRVSKTTGGHIKRRHLEWPSKSGGMCPVGVGYLSATRWFSPWYLMPGLMWVSPDCDRHGEPRCLRVSPWEPRPQG